MVTLRLLMPPPTGVVSGLFNATPRSLMTASVSAGSHCPVILNAVSPASNSSQRKDTSPAVEDLTVASTTSLVAFIISGPTPSPGMNGMTISLDNMITYLTQCEVSVLPQMRDE